MSASLQLALALRQADENRDHLVTTLQVVREELEAGLAELRELAHVPVDPHGDAPGMTCGCCAEGQCRCAA